MTTYVTLSALTAFFIAAFGFSASWRLSKFVPALAALFDTVMLISVLVLLACAS